MRDLKWLIFGAAVALVGTGLRGPAKMGTARRGKTLYLGRRSGA
jgi:hypothetical protein